MRTAMTDEKMYPSEPTVGRLLSLDALRGFDMFWIVGADSIVEALQKISKTGVIGFIGYELDHAQWEGFRFEDLIFPMFVFMMGAAIPFSLGRITGTEGKQKAYARLLRRAALLYGIGVIYYGGFGDPIHKLRLMGVLQRIGLCYLFAGLLYLNFNLRGLILACAAFLAGYWALLSFVPAPGMPHVSFAPNENWPNYIDLHFLPGRLWDKTWDPEGILSTIPAISTALFGVFAGLLVKSKTIPDKKKVAYLACAGAAAAILGFLWGLQFPVIKKLWTSSYVLVAGGYSAMLLALFYWIIDVRQSRAWAAPFLWIGSNALTIYLLNHYVDFGDILNWCTAGAAERVLGNFGDLLLTTLALGIEIGIIWILYRKKIFLRL